MYCWSIVSPIGKLTGVEDGGFMIKVLLNARSLPAEEKKTPLLSHWVQQTEEYFAGKRTAFDLPLKLAGSDFQRSVWQGIKEIGYGEVMSYGQLAEKINRPKAFRAVGSACGANPLPIIIPCHRVVAKGGLGGFGLGLEAKKILLKLENPNFAF